MLHKVDPRVHVVDIALSCKRAHWVNLFRVSLVILSSEFVIGLFAIHCAKLALSVDILLASLELMVDAVVLVVVILKCHHLVLVDVHGVFNLSQGKRKINFISFLVGL